MKLKFKPLGIESGRPIAFISKEFGESSGIYEGSRIEILHKNKKTIMLADVVDKILKRDEISFSVEAVSYLKLQKGEKVEVSVALQPVSTRFILKKLNHEKLSKEEIFSIINDIVNNALSEAEIAYFVSGVYHCKMSLEETYYLTDAMAKTGQILKWKESVADKHSIGGIAGNRTTPIVVSICAAAGVKMPKTSSRAITSAAGTADTLETITNVNLTVKELRSVVEKTNACFAWGGSLGLAPADDKLIRVERLLNVDPESQLIASILAKKISVGSKYILIDIPWGHGAKVTIKEAKDLGKKFIAVGKKFGLKIRIVLTDGSQPIGNGIGPILEMIDVLKVLKRDNPPKDLESKSVFLASHILEMVGKAKQGAGRKMAQELLDSGEAYKKFNEIVDAQGRKNTILKPSKYSRDIKAERNGTIKHIDSKSINLISRVLGSPSDAGAGIYIYKHTASKIKKGEKLLTLYSQSEKKLKEALRLYKDSEAIKF